MTTNASSSVSHVMPAEWMPHAACLLLYPHNPSTFRVPLAEKEFLNVAKAIVEQGEEDVVLCCIDPSTATRVGQACKSWNQPPTQKQHQLHVLVCPSDDTWARDTGPTFVVPVIMDSKEEKSNNSQAHEIIGLDWEFNAYGGPSDGCYWPCERDRLVAPTMCKALSQLYHCPISTRKIPLVLEGGAIHTDGNGTILVTQECLCHPNRNPDKTRNEIETMVLQALGGTKMIWIPSGVHGDDDTNGHIDNMACFVRPGHVLLSWTDDHEQDSENYQRCRSAMQVLERERDAKGRKLTIHKLQLPPPMFYCEQVAESLMVSGVSARKVGERMAASYVNFYISNKAVVVPQFGHSKTDTAAIETIATLFPDRRAVGVQSKEILLGGGNIHCITQQLPKI